MPCPCCVLPCCRALQVQVSLRPPPPQPHSHSLVIGVQGVRCIMIECQSVNQRQSQGSQGFRQGGQGGQVRCGGGRRSVSPSHTATQPQPCHWGAGVLCVMIQCQSVSHSVRGQAVSQSGREGRCAAAAGVAAFQRGAMPFVFFLAPPCACLLATCMHAFHTNPMGWKLPPPPCMHACMHAPLLCRSSMHA